MNNIVCRTVDLPPRINAVTVIDENGDFNIYLNARLSEDERQRAFRHELRHIRMRHFYKTEKNITDCEKEAKTE